jgi:2-iminobutanoate/2-iminopropanoate deaminase
VFTAGQLPVDPKSGELVAGEIDEQASRAFENIRAVLEAAGSSLDKVVKLTVLLHDIGDLQGVAEVRRRYWSDPHPISTTFQAGRLPMEGALLEVEAMAVL